jgi:hypothetical protein
VTLLNRSGPKTPRPISRSAIASRTHEPILPKNGMQEMIAEGEPDLARSLLIPRDKTRQN